AGTPWAAPPKQAASWPFQILPFIEASASQNQSAGFMRNTVMSAYICPTRHPLRKLSGATAAGGAPLDYASPYFGPQSSDPATIRNTPSSFFGTIVPAELGNGDVSNVSGTRSTLYGDMAV